MLIFDGGAEASDIAANHCPDALGGSVFLQEFNPLIPLLRILSTQAIRRNAVLFQYFRRPSELKALAVLVAFCPNASAGSLLYSELGKFRREEATSE
jgi:hypothetical protein